MFQWWWNVTTASHSGAWIRYLELGQRLEHENREMDHKAMLTLGGHKSPICVTRQGSPSLAVAGEDHLLSSHMRLSPVAAVSGGVPIIAQIHVVAGEGDLRSIIKKMTGSDELVKSDVISTFRFKIRNTETTDINANNCVLESHGIIRR